MARNNRPFIIRVIWAATAALFAPWSLTAQQPLVKNQPLPFPIVPLMVHYESASQYFMQWIDEKAPYSMIEAFSTKEQPQVFQIGLTERGTGKRVYYSNSAARVKLLRDMGKETHLVKIDYQVTKSIEQPAAYAFAFPDERGRAIRWRFIPAAGATAQGEGVSPQQPDEPGLRLRYRERATTAGSGTAIQIGDQVFEASPWPEVSAPPYFIAHRGSYVEGMPFGSFFFGTENWRVAAAPVTLSEGAEWLLTNDHENTRRLRIAQIHGDTLLVSEVVNQPSLAAAIDLELRALPGGFALNSLILRNGPHVMSIRFSPELNLAPGTSDQQGTEVTYQIDEDKHKKVSRGIVVVSREGPIMRLRWQPHSPDWAKSHVLQATVTVRNDSYSIETR